MENLLMFLATSLVLRIPAPKFQRYLIGQSNCSSLLATGGNTLHINYTKEGDKIYFNEQIVEETTYGLICAQMQGVHTLSKAEILLVQYINRVRQPFDIAFNISMEIERANQKIVITDYWQDKKGIDWKIKGYTDGKTVAVLYVKNISDAPVKEHDAFLNSFQFSSAA